MGGVFQVNNAYNIDSKRLHKKLSFTIGDKFMARVANLDKLTNEAVLKLLDGWEFSAKLKNPVDFTPEGLIKFQIDGYENGKLIIKMLGGPGEEAKENIISDTLEEHGINIKQEDYSIIEKMLKYKMPLTKENISKIKSIIDFQEKILEDPGEEDNFIMKYLTNKGTDINSEKGQSIANTLKGFFREFKNLSIDELMTFVENDIQLTEENIRSFNKLNNESMTIYKEIKGLEGELSKENSQNLNPKGIQTEEKVVNLSSLTNENGTEDNKLSASSKVNSYIQNAYTTNELKELDKKEILKRLLDLDNTDNNIKDGIINNIGKDNAEVKTISGNAENSNKTILNSEVDKFIENELTNKEATGKDIHNKLLGEKLETSQKVKDEINNKINEMKEIIKQIIDENSTNSDASNKILQNLQSKINDLKMFNSISNQYYYLDVPINLNDREYPCKLIIKDDRKKGKKIDSTNVKFVASVKTVNMGVVDAYIKVSNSNINVDIKSEEKWVKILEIGKGKIEKTLKNMGFAAIINFEVKESEKEANLVEARDFFEDNEFTRINLKV